eukprot:1297857-Pleurochrysis_carterae.AAC.1
MRYLFHNTACCYSSLAGAAARCLHFHLATHSHLRLRHDRLDVCGKLASRWVLAARHERLQTNSLECCRMHAQERVDLLAERTAVA